jgi:hypothetical protein
MKPSASDNPPDAQIRRLSAAGWPIRRIAREVGLSRSRVHEVLSAPQTGDGDPDPWDEGDEAELALDDDTDDPYTEPFTFVGSERTWFTRGQGNGGYWADVERIMDNPRAVNQQPAAAKALAGLLDKLRSASARGRRGNLAVVRQMSERDGA